MTSFSINMKIAVKLDLLILNDDNTPIVQFMKIEK